MNVDLAILAFFIMKAKDVCLILFQAIRGVSPFLNRGDDLNILNDLQIDKNLVLKLYCRYLYTRPCMINHIWGLKQL